MNTFRGLEILDGVNPDVIKTKLDRHLIPLFFVLGIVCYLDRTNLSFAAVQLSQQLNLSCATYGLGAGLFFLGYSFQVPSTMALNRFGAPSWLAFTVIVWGMIAISFAATTGRVMFLCLRVALGLAECGTFPGIWTHLSHFYTTRELGAAYAAVTTSTAIAQVFGAPLAAFILSFFDGFLGIAGWQWLFIMEGLTTIIYGVCLKLLLAPSPAQAKCLSLLEREWLQRRQNSIKASNNEDKGLKSQLKSAFEAFRNWRVWYLSVIWFTVTQSMYGIIFFAPMMIHQMFSTSSSSMSVDEHETAALSPLPSIENVTTIAHTSNGGCSAGDGAGRSHSTSYTTGAGVALLSMIPFTAAAIAMVINAKMAEIANERHRHAGIPILLGSFFMILTPLMLQFIAPLAAFISLVCAAASVWAFHGPFMSWPAVFLEGAQQKSAGFAIMNSLGSLGGLLGPLLLGVLASRANERESTTNTSDGQQQYNLAMFVLGGVLGLGGIMILLFPVPTASSNIDSFEQDAEKTVVVEDRYAEAIPILPRAG